MKLAAVLALAAVAFASTAWETRPEIIRDNAFKAGEHYTFRFDGQVSSGLPLPSSQHAATRIQSIISFYMENDRSAIVKMQKIRIGSAHRDLVEPRDLQPFGLFEEQTLPEEQMEKLLMPVRFRYEQGLVSEVEFDGEDQPWSENIKRAVLNMLQINLGKKARTDEAEMARLLRGPEEQYESGRTDAHDFFTTNELTLEGDCETAYTIVPTKASSEEEPSVRVSKSINFEKCAKRVDIRYNFRFGEECPSCDAKLTGEERNTESSTVMTFELNGAKSADAFLIREAELRSQYVFSPVSKEQSVLATFVHNKLVLLRKEQGPKVEAPRRGENSPSTIVYSTEWEQKLERFRMTGEESLLREIAFPWLSKKMHIAKLIIADLLKELPTLHETESKEAIRPEFNHQIARLVEVLRVATKAELAKIAEEFEGKKEARALFFDTLAIAGTKNTIEFLTEKMLSKEMSPLRAARVLKELINVRNPSEQIIDNLIRTCKDEVAERSPLLKQSCWLTVGSLLNGMCGVKRERFASEVSFESMTGSSSTHNKHSKNVCPAALKEKYVEVLVKVFDKAETQYEKILAIKTLANTGIDMIVFPLEKIIKNEREEKPIRLAAIDGLRKLRSVMPRKLHSILMPLFKATREQPEIRVAAFHQIMQTLPARAVVDQITAQLEREPSRNVHSFVYSSLKALAESPLPCEAELARDITASLRMARRQPARLFASSHVRAAFYDQEYAAGAALNWAHLFAADSVLPKEMMASIDGIFTGEWNKYLAQIGFSQHNIDELLYKMIEKYDAEFSSEDSSEEKESVVVRGKRGDVKPMETLRKMMEKMGIQSRKLSTSSSSGKPSAMLYIRYKDMDYAVLPIDETMIKSALKEGKQQLSEVVRMLAKGVRFEVETTSFIYETTRVIPTTLGLPLEITGKVPTVFAVRGEVKVEPKSDNTGAKVVIRAEPRVSSTHVSSMEIRSPIVSTGSKMLHNMMIRIPVDVEMQLNWENKFDAKFIIRAPESREEKRLFSLQSRPVTFVRHENKPAKMDSANEKTVVLAEQPTTEIETVYGESVMGVRFALRGSVHRHLLQKLQAGSTLPLLVCENWIELTSEKTPVAPREYTIRIAASAFESLKTRSEKPDFGRFYDKDNEEHFAVEDSEYLEENEKERKAGFESYLKSYSTEESDRTALFAHRVHIKAEAGEKRIEGELKAVCDADATFCKWTLAGERSPLSHEESRREWSIKAEAQTLFPAAPRTLSQLHEQKHREVVASLTATWGAEQKNTIRMRAQAEQSADQQKWQRLTIRKEGEVVSRGQSAYENVERLELASRLNQIKLVAEYEIAPETQVQLARISSLLVAVAPLSSSVESRRVERVFQKEGKLIAKLAVEPQTWRYANVSIETPAERIQLENVRLPIRPTWLSIEKVQPMRSVKDVHRRITAEATCEVSDRRVNTFDDVIFRAPLTTCYSVLAKDCSEGKFAVLMKNVEKKGEEKKVKIITEEGIIEFETKKNGEEIVVIVDGKVIKESRKLEQNGIDASKKMVVFENEDIRVRFDGFKAEIKLNELYKNKQCGICGHYDGEEEGEFRRADNVETEEIEEFHRSFLNKDDECEMEEEKLSKKDNYKKYEREFSRLAASTSDEESSEEERFEDDLEMLAFQKKDNKKTNKRFSSYEQDEEIEPIEKTRVIETTSRICFSQEPVPECPKNARKEETLKLKAKFACLERSSTEARRLLREAREGVVGVGHLKNSFVEELVVPKTCVVY